MTLGESPAVARRRVRLALRSARETAGFTQVDVAGALDWSLSKVNRIEKGDVTVSRTDLLAMLELYGIEDREQVDDLVRAARTSRQRGWWDEPRYREHLTSAGLQLLQFENDVAAIRCCFQPTLVAGLLQPQTHAAAIMDFWQDDDLSNAHRAARLMGRMRPRDHILAIDDAPHYVLILDESVLWREVGGSKVMAEQLRDLVGLVRQRSIDVRFLPFTDSAVTATLGPFSILDLGDEENAVLYRDSHPLDDAMRINDTYDRHRRYFEQLWATAMNEHASTHLTAATTAAILACLDP